MVWKSTGNTAWPLLKVALLLILVWGILAPNAAQAELGKDWQSAAGIPWNRYDDTPIIEFKGKFWLIGGSNSSDIWSSIDGESWNLELLEAPFGARSEHSLTVYDGKLWLIGGYRPDYYNPVYLNDVWCSENGVDWTLVTEHATFYNKSAHACVSFAGKLWVIGGFDRYSYNEDIWYSTDGKTWTEATRHAPFGGRSDHTCIVYDGKIWVIGGFIGTKTVDTSVGPFTLRETTSDVWYSSDGINWTKACTAPFFPRRGHSTVVKDGKLWVIGGCDQTPHAVNTFGFPFYTTRFVEVEFFTNDTWYSEDGITWLQATDAPDFDQRYNHSSFVIDDKIWVVGGAVTGSLRGFDSPWRFARNDSWYSDDGISWSQNNKAFMNRTEFSCVSYKGEMWVIGGKQYNVQTSGVQSTYLNDVWHSNDGTEWAQITANAGFSARMGHSSVVFEDKIWVIGGFDGAYKNDVWCSSDGISWTQVTNHAPFLPRLDHTSLVYDNKLWVIGGTVLGAYTHARNDVWYTTDGINWIQATDSAAFLPHEKHTSVVFKNKMWVIGGSDGTTGFGGGSKNDVWFSTNGIDWTQATDNAAFSARQNHSSAVFDGKMWVITGTGNQGKSDVWYSPNGSDWTISTPNAPFPGRQGQSCIVHQNKIWVLGGFDFVSRNDVWYSELAPPNIHPTPTALDFGNLQLGLESSPQSIAIENIGELPLEITDAYISGSDADEFVLLPRDDKSILTLAPGETTTYRVAFAPTASLGEVPFHERSAQLVIESNDPDTPALAVPLMGRSEKDPAPEGISAVEDWMALEE